MTERTEIDTTTLPEEQDVAAYLQRHPDFFLRNEGLLTDLRIPHAVGGAVSLVERQVLRLREQKQELERRLQQLARTARNNEQLLERLQALILELIVSPDADTAIRLLDRALRDDFHADFVSLRLFGDVDRPEAIAADAPGIEALAPALAARKPVCGYLDPEQKAFLFGAHAGEVASAMLIPLCESACDACLGLLAIGSVDPKRYHSEMGTVFIAHLGAVATRILRARL